VLDKIMDSDRILVTGGRLLRDSIDTCEVDDDVDVCVVNQEAHTDFFKSIVEKLNTSFKHWVVHFRFANSKVCKVLNLAVIGGLSVDIVHVEYEKGIDLKFFHEEVTPDWLQSLDEESKNAIEGWWNMVQIEKNVKLKLSPVVSLIKQVFKRRGIYNNRS